jgi:glycosyltransferase involved in cell wall biosynthesis
VFVFPSRTDTAGNVVLEAQAAGLPVIVSDEGGPREHMRPDVTGVVCGVAPEAWTGAAARLLTDTAARRAMGAAAREYALTRSWPATLAPLYDAWRAAAGRHSAAAESAAVQGPRRVA